MKNRNTRRLLLTGLVTAATVGSASAQGTAPVDVAAIGTQLAGYVPTAAAAGLAVFAAIIGAKIIIKAFKTVMQ